MAWCTAGFTHLWGQLVQVVWIGVLWLITGRTRQQQNALILNQVLRIFLEADVADQAGARHCSDLIKIMIVLNKCREKWKPNSWNGMPVQKFLPLSQDSSYSKPCILDTENPWLPDNFCNSLLHKTHLVWWLYQVILQILRSSWFLWHSFHLGCLVHQAVRTEAWKL